MSDCEKNLILRCQLNDKKAFEELFELYHPRLKYYVIKIAGAEVDDILQDIWLAVIKGINKLQKTISFKAWLFQIARNKVYEKYRNEKKNVPLPKEYIDYSNIKNSSEQNKIEQLQNAFNYITPNEREILILFFIEQMSYQTIAQILDCNIGTVKSRLHYAKKSLKKILEMTNE